MTAHTEIEMSFEAWWAGKHGQTSDVSEAHYELMRDSYGQGKIDECEACLEAAEDANLNDKGPHRIIEAIRKRSNNQS